MRSRPIAVFGFILLAACGSDVGDILLSTRPNDSREDLPGGVRQGDTLTLYATEVDGSGAPTGSFGHQSVTWTTQTPDIFEIPASGLIVSKAFGAGRLTIRGTRSERTITMWVYPPDTRIVLSPRDTAVEVGQTLTMTSTVLHGASTVLQDASASQAVITHVFSGSSPLEPVTGSKSQFRAVRSGASWMHGSIGLYKRPAIRDSIRVTVR